MQKSLHQSTFSEGSGKTRALIKSLAFLVMCILLLMLVGLLGSMLSIKNSGLYYGLGGTIVCFMTAFLFVRYEKQLLSTIGLQWQKKTVFRFIYGLLIGTGLFMFVLAVIYFTAGYRITPVKVVDYTAVLFNVIPVFFLALMEEISFRTYPLQKLEKAYGIIITQLLLALLFALYHILNGWGVAISFLGPFIWSFVFVLSASWSGGIAMSTGIHFALNVTQHLVGLKGGNMALFNLEEITGTKETLLSHQSAGLLAHFLVLFGASWVTLWYSRKKSK